MLFLFHQPFLQVKTESLALKSFVFYSFDADGKLGTNAVDVAGNKVPLASLLGGQRQAMLNELRKEQKRVAELEGTVARLAATVKEQAAQIQKVSAQLAAASPSRGGLEVSGPAPEVVNNP